MLTKWKMQQVVQVDAIRTARIHLGNRAEVFIWQNFRPAWRDLGCKNREFYSRAGPSSNMSTSKLLQKDFEIRRDLGNRASPVKRVHVKRPIRQNLMLSLGKGGWGFSQNLTLMNSSSCFTLLHHHLVKYSLMFLFFVFFFHSNLLSTHLFVGSSP